MSEIVTPEQTNPLLYFEELIQNGGINRCYDKFKVDEEMLVGNAPGNTLEFTFVEQDELGRHTRYTESFKQRLDKEFKNAYRKTLILISEYVASKSLNEIKERIKITLDIIFFLHQHTKDINTYGQKEVIDKWLRKLTKFVQDKYPAYVSHPVLSLLNEELKTNSRDGYFEFKGGRTQAIKLFKMVLCETGLFAEEEVNEEDFVKVLLSENPEKLNIVLQISCTEQKAAYIFEAMHLFGSFTDIKLVNSKCFKTRQGNLFKQNRLQSARSKYKRNISKVDERNEIDAIFRDFAKK